MRQSETARRGGSGSKRQARDGVCTCGGTPKPETLMSSAEVAELIGVPQQTIYYWRSSGLGPRALKVGKYVKFRPSDVMAWLATLEEAA